mmetsp:Transcript_98527/g.205477  ORF Transcript_98527/g.205477 Transcript_98527/m.205477 type:complete len:452 (-) Transcript_98527:61-1416(-)
MSLLRKMNNCGLVHNRVASQQLAGILTLPASRFFGQSASPGMHQTPIVDLLWSKRKAKYQGIQIHDSGEKHERQLVAKAPSASAQSVTYMFSDPENGWLVDKYRNPWGFVRPGRLFEDLDALAGTIAFEHCRAEDPMAKSLHIVTASVDRIKYRKRPNLEDDLVMSGRVTWVGRSSMEIQMRAQSSKAEEPFMESIFTFVARDPETGKAARINPLKVDGAEAEALFQMGEHRDAARKEMRKRQKASRGLHGLDEAGVDAAHALLEQAQARIVMPAMSRPMDMFLRETRLENTFLTMPQQRNTAGRIFGGFLMRRAYELARSTAHIFGGRRPIFHELDEVAFRAPVNVGDMVKFESCVLYTSQEIDAQGRATVHTEVDTWVIQPESGEAVLSNTFNFTFGLAANPDGTGGSVKGTDIVLRRVLPANREEAYKIVERYMGDRAQVEEDVKYRH